MLKIPHQTRQPHEDICGEQKTFIQDFDDDEIKYFLSSNDYSDSKEDGNKKVPWVKGHGH